MMSKTIKEKLVNAIKKVMKIDILNFHLLLTIIPLFLNA